MITAIENIGFEKYFRFIWIQTYRIFYFSQRLFTKHQTWIAQNSDSIDFKIVGLLLS